MVIPSIVYSPVDGCILSGTLETQNPGTQWEASLSSRPIQFQHIGRSLSVAHIKEGYMMLKIRGDRNI